MTAITKFLLLGLISILSASAAADTVYTDSLTSGLSLPWSNTRGNWVSTNVGYYAQNPNNSPLTATLLPYALTDFTVSVNYHGASDGGIFLRSDATGDNGILLVLGGSSHTGTGVYWHLLQGGCCAATYSGANGLFNQGDNISVRVVVSGFTYAAYVNGNLVSTLTNNSFTAGQVGLYDFTGQGHYPVNQSFTDFELDVRDSNVPEPATSVLLGSGLIGVVGTLRRKIKI